MEPPQEPRSKAERTRERIVNAAVWLFRRRGFERTTLRDIAAKADVSLGLVYRYFESKDALVLELYEQLSAEFDEAARRLPPGPWALRFVAALRTSISVLQPHRETLRALLSANTIKTEGPLLVPGQPVLRERVEARFIDAVAGAEDAPATAVELGKTLYLVHLIVLLCWVLDRSPAQVATSRALELLERCAPFITPLFESPMVRAFGTEASEILRAAILGTDAPRKEETP